MELDRRVSLVLELLRCVGGAGLTKQITPTQFNEFVTTLNTHLISAYSTRGAVIDNLIAIATWWISLWFRPGHFETVCPTLWSMEYAHAD